MIQILFYLYLSLFTLFLFYLLLDSYSNSCKTYFIKCICNVFIQLLGLIYFVIIENYLMVGVTSVIIFGHMILVAYKVIKQHKNNRRFVPYNNLQFDNQIFNETGIINETFENPFNYGLDNDTEESFEYCLSDDYNDNYNV